MPTTETTQDLLRSIMLVVASGGIAWFLGGRQKSKTESKVADGTTSAALVNAATAGFTASMGSNAAILDKYVTLINDMSEIKTEFGTVKQELAVVKKELEYVKEESSNNAKNLIISNKKSRVLAGIVISREQEIREKDNLIESLLIIISSVHEGRESVDVVITKIEKMVKTFTSKYDSRSNDPLDEILRITSGAGSVKIAAELLDDMLTDYIQTIADDKEEVKESALPV